MHATKKYYQSTQIGFAALVFGVQDWAFVLPLELLSYRRY